MGKIIRNGINYSSTTDAAKNINYDNSASGLAATTAQKAIDELNRKIAAGGGGSSSNIVYLTQAEYDALPDDKLENDIEYWITDAGVRGSAENVSYDASVSGLDAKNVQEAVDKLAEGAGNGGNVEYLTQAQYDELGEEKLSNGIEYRITDTGTPTTASNVGFDGTTSGIDAINVQGAIENLDESIDNLNNRLSNFYFSTNNAKSIPNDEQTIVESVTLEEGFYLLYFSTIFKQNETGYRLISINTGLSTTPDATMGCDASKNAGTRVEKIRLAKPSSTTTFNFYLKQNSGAALNVDYVAKVIKLG